MVNKTEWILERLIVMFMVLALSCFIVGSTLTMVYAVALMTSHGVDPHTAAIMAREMWTYFIGGTLLSLLLCYSCKLFQKQINK